MPGGRLRCCLDLQEKEQHEGGLGDTGGWVGRGSGEGGRTTGSLTIVKGWRRGRDYNPVIVCITTQIKHTYLHPYIRTLHALHPWHYKEGRKGGH